MYIKKIGELNTKKRAVQFGNYARRENIRDERRVCCARDNKTRLFFHVVEFRRCVVYIVFAYIASR